MPLDRTATNRSENVGVASLSVMASSREGGIGEEAMMRWMASELAFRSVGSIDSEFCKLLACRKEKNKKNTKASYIYASCSCITL